MTIYFKLNKIFLTFIILCLIFINQNVIAENNRFYFWQRTYTPEIYKNLNKESPQTTMYYFAGEIKANNINHFPYPLLSIPRKWIPTIRCEDKLSKELFQNPQWRQKIINLIITINNFHEKNHNKIDEIQFDFDCPERLMTEYGIFIQKLKKELPIQLKISLTTLICHVNNKAFNKMIFAADEFVLQVHGFSPPIKIDKKNSLINLSEAEKAIKKATFYNKPYRVALPTYGHLLCFDSKSQNLVKIASENYENFTNYSQMILKNVSPSPKDVFFLYQQIKATTQCQGVVWFRFPILGERLNWNREFITSFEQQILPKAEIQIKWTKGEKNIYYLSLKNQGVLTTKKIILTLTSQINGLRYGLYGINIKTQGGYPNILPQTITLFPPSPGEEENILWISSIQEKDLPFISILLEE